jgi:4-amino-4-deoxy-L-arabinose transferase-like glycosyltransferase
LTALASPPNSADAMAYHMPRVIYWCQQRNVSFFATPYLNQIMLQPLAEYFMLQTFLLSSGDHLINCIQWLGSVGSILAVSLIAQWFGAGRRGQIFAALFCATLPNGIMQASGAKNDYLLTLWLAAMTYFALRFVRSFARADLVYCGLALGLALATKATAYLFVPGLLLAVFFPAIRAIGARRLAFAGLVLAAGVLLVNTPQYVRNIDFSGSPLGFDSAQGDGFFRWRNETFGWKDTLSNMIRNVADQLGAPSQRWNQRVYDTVLWLHSGFHANVNDSHTTWPWTVYEPPRYANHEANANNRWHLLILFAASILLAFRSDKPSKREMVYYLLGILMGFVLFSFYLKWQLYLARLFLPLFVLAAPVVAVEMERLRPIAIQWLVCLFLLNNSRPFLFENWTRPLKGSNSVLRTSRDDNYFADMNPWHNKESFERAVELISRTNCNTVGIDSNGFQLEYPLQALLREKKPSIVFVHTGVNNVSAKYAFRQRGQPCAVLCMDCAGKPGLLNRYRVYAQNVTIGEFVVFLP